MDDDDGVMVDGYLDELLTKAGLTRPQLAALSGVSYSHVANVANGTKPLTTKVGLKIAKALGLELAELMARKPAVPDASGTVDALGIVSMHTTALRFLKASNPIAGLCPKGSLLRFVAGDDWQPGAWQLVEVAGLTRLVQTTATGFTTTYGEEVARSPHHRPIARLVEVRTFYG